jgi:hypothetical protein
MRFPRTAGIGAQGPLNTGAAPHCGPGGHAGRVGAGISQAKHERLCAEPSEIPSDATAILLVSPAVMPLQILFFAQDLTVEQPGGRPGINQCYPIWGILKIRQSGSSQTRHRLDCGESPTYGEQEGSAYNGHFGCTCYHPLFVFNQFGDVERCALRPGNVHSAAGWRAVLELVIARYRGTVKRLYFRGDAALANPEMYEYLEAEGIGYTIRLLANDVLQRQIGNLLTRPVGRPPHEVRPLLRQLHLAGAELEQAAPRRGQSRMASGRALPVRRLYRDQSCAACRAGRRLLQPARHG